MAITSFSDRVVVVTGAGSGIGHATALAFAREGARLAVCDLNGDRLAAVSRELGDRLLVAEVVDVADRAQMHAFADAVHTRVPAADIVVNNAGVGIGGPFLATSLDDWDWVLGINLRGVVHGCHFFIPSMVEQGSGGHVVNLSSILGILAPPYTSAYTATKFAVRGLSESLRHELAAYGIGVTAVCPGLIATSIMEDGRMVAATDERRRKVAGRFRKGSSPEKVAAAVLRAVRTNTGRQLVGADAHAISAVSRVVPSLLGRLGSALRW